MKNTVPVRVLGVVLAAEVLLGVVLLVTTRHWPTLIIISAMYIVLGVAGYLLAQTGVFQQDWSKPRVNKETVRQPMNQSNMGMTFSGFKIGLGGIEQTEPVNLEYDANENLKSIKVDVQVGTLRVTAQPGLDKIRVSGVKRVWVRETAQAPFEFENLQVRGVQENGVLQIYAGTAEKISVAVGQVNRIDLNVLVPDNLPCAFTTQSGEVVVKGMQADTTLRSNTGSMTVENFGSGKNLTVNSQSGNITLSQIAAGTVQVSTSLGAINLTGGGAEQFNLESNAGTIRVRGVNCGSYRAKTSAGSVEAYEVNSDGPVEMRANLGRVYAQNVNAPGFIMTTDAGAVFYYGKAPSVNSEARSNLGLVQLRFTPGASFNLDASSSVGNVAVTLPPSTVYQQNRNLFRGAFGTGGAVVHAASNLGSVQVSY
jgi:hypothetical protein